MSDQIKHTDIYEPSLMDGFVKEILAGINVLDNLEKKTLEVSGVIKKNLSNTDIGSFEGIKKVTEAQKQANDVFLKSNEVLKLKKQLENDLQKQLESITAKSIEQAKTIDELTKKYDALNQKQKENKKLTEEEKLARQKNNQLAKESAKLQSDLTGAYEKATVRLARMARQLKDLSVAGMEDATSTKLLKQAYDELFVTVSKAEQSVGQHQRNVGNYAGSFNGLQNSINQVTRELPAFVNSAQTGFMAISNNIPILVDQFHALKKANAELNAEGKATTPVWKQMLSGIFSWQTALSVGITLITVYGKEIGNMVSGLFGVKDATEDVAKAQEDWNKQLDATIERVTRLNKEQIADLDFSTKAYIIAMKKRGASAKEIFDFEQQQRDNAIQKSLDAEEKLTQDGKLALEKRLALENQLYDDAKNEELIKAVQMAKDAEEKVGQARITAEANTEKLRQEKALANATFELEQEKAKEDAKEKARKDAITRLEKAEKKRQENADRIAKLTKKQLHTEFKDIQKDLKDKERAEEERLRNEREFRDLMNKLTAEMEEEQRQEDERLAKEKFDAEQKRFKDSINALQQFSNDRNAIKMREVERDIELSKRRETELQAIALQGSEDARNNIAFERRRQAELERERRRQIEAQKRTELGLSVLKAYQSNVERDPNGALKRTLTDISVLSGAIRSLPSFEKGTENTGKQGNGIDGRGGFLSVLHPEERVMTKGQNKKVGGLSNEELSDIAWMYNLGMLKNATEVKSDVNLNELNSNVKELISVVKSRPTQNIDIDVVKKLWTLTEKSNKGVTKKTGLFK